MVGAEGDRRNFWWWSVIYVVVFGVALALAVVPHLGDSDPVEPVPWAESRATSDVTCGDMKKFEAEYALATKVTEELELPDGVDRQDAVTKAEDAIYSACGKADPNEHPVDSDFKGSLRGKLTGRH
jgi:hypothetical protein